MKTVLVSALVLNGSRSGYRRIIKNLVEYLEGAGAASELRFIFLFQRKGWESLEIPTPRHPAVRVEVLDDFRSKWARGFAEQLIVPWYALRFRADLIFMPSTFGLILPVRPVVAFVHTTTSFAMPKELRGRGRMQQVVHDLLLRMTAWTSRILLFTSEQTHREFCAFVGRKLPARILGNGLRISPSGVPLSSVTPGLSSREYVLSVSQFYRLKNFDGLLRAFVRGKERGSIPERLHLVLVGTVQEPDYYEELRHAAAGRGDVHFLHDIRDEALSCLYEHAAAYAFFSHFEGFSLTPAEAMLHRLPVAISAIPTHREIYGDAVFYADPRSDEDIERALARVVAADVGGSPPEGMVSRFSFEAFLERLYAAFREAA